MTSKLLMPPLVSLPPKTIPSPVGTSTGTLNLQDEQKRWLVVGICLNKVLLPCLRDFLKPEIQKHYNNLKTSDNIDKQTYAKHLEKDKTVKLNYESINNNEANHKRKVKLYDYNVKSEVDLAKLYLKPFMAKFSAFDDTCDLSAVLGILSSASVFTPIQKLSSDVRQEVRNEWGHCNFLSWTPVKFAKSFQLMDSLLHGLNLNPVQEKKFTEDLGDWETKGMQLCMGNVVDADLVQFIEEEVSHLQEDVKHLEAHHGEESQKIHDALVTVQEFIQDFKKDTNEALKDLHQKVVELNTNTSDIAEGMESLKDDLTRRLDDVEEKHESLDKRVEALESAIKCKSDLPEVANVFQAPDRVPCFYGRTDELLKLLDLKAAPCKMSAICGLGGTGKTSLAIEHVWKAKDNYKGGVFWLSGESVSQFQNSISEMARQVGTFDDDVNKTLSKTLHWLQTRKEYWCLVIDNLDEYDLKDSAEMLKVLCGHWRRSAAGHIIITSRREMKQIQEDIPGVSSENCIALGNLSVNESVEFLKLRTEKSIQRNDSVLSDLAAELGYLPLALDQAAAYIKNTSVSFSDYLVKYRKQKLNTLKRFKAHYPAQDTSPQRIAIHTTWELNFSYVSRMSEEYDIGQAASFIMEVSSFLYPDDIPLEIINEGLPRVENEDLYNCISSPIGVTDILSVLTKFSLFQKFTDKSISVHRLVQEVIRSKISKDRINVVLQSASRMLHHAFANTKSPAKVCQKFEGDAVFIQDNPPSLHLWGKLGSHANALQVHLINACNQYDVVRQQLLNTEETAFLLNEASLYLDVCRQKVAALELQKTKLEILTKLDEVSQEQLFHLKYFDIPVKNLQFKLISHCMGQPEDSISSSEPILPEKENEEEAVKWRLKGNEAFKHQDYQTAIDFYTLALKHFSNDFRSLCNRALCYLKVDEAGKALKDCERCLSLDKNNIKALMRKAWALFELSKTNSNLKGRAKAAAAVVAHVDKNALKQKPLSEMFPDLNYKEISNSAQLVASYLYLIPGTTFLLRKGLYELKRAMIDQDLQLIAIDDNVTLKFLHSFQIFGSNLYAEGISFPSASESIVCQMKGSVTMYKCHISTGRRGCDDYPECNGGPGCVASLYPSLPSCDRTGKFGVEEPSGVIGLEGITLYESSGYFEDCDIWDCGAAAILCHGNGAFLSIKSSKVHQNHVVGLQVKRGASLEATDNDICSNGHYGILIGPYAGSCKVIDNQIYENFKDGISVYKTSDTEVIIERNRIYHNLPHGLFLNTCQAQIQRNEIFENGFYGIYAQFKTTANIDNNEIYSNKCGGILIGLNFSGRVIVTNNMVRDHNGPWLEHASVSIHRFKSVPIDLPEGEKRVYSIPPIIKDNDLRNNEEGRFHPKEKMELVKNECGFCRRTKTLSKCSRCNIASYCNTSCQEKHWKKHKSMCSAISDKYSVIVDPLSEKGFQILIFGSHLKGIFEGPTPDPKSKKKFIVKIQNSINNCHPLQLLTVYDQSTTVQCEIQSPEVFHIIMECGVLGGLDKSTSKKAFFYASFVENGKKLKIDLAQLAPYQKW